MITWLRHWLWVGFQVWFIACVAIPYALWAIVAIVDEVRERIGKRND